MQKMYEEQGYQESLLVTSGDINRLADRSQKVSIKDFFERSHQYEVQKRKRAIQSRQVRKSQELKGCTFRPLTSRDME
jgi:hypothetical protein